MEQIFLNEGTKKYVVGNKMVMRWGTKQLMGLIFSNKRNEKENTGNKTNIKEPKIFVGLILNSTWNKYF
jgi:hypothetical protein